MSQRRNCSARQHSDQMVCGKCGIQWDVNDPDPPACQPLKHQPPTDRQRRKGQRDGKAKR